MILVTGGAGFIGSNLVKALHEKGAQDIVVCDHFGETLKFKNLNAFDIADYIEREDLLSRLDQFKDAEAIFHLGACSATTELDGVYLTHNNYEFTKTLFLFCQENEIPFYYASSASVYGNGDHGFREIRSTEYPLNSYAWSKFQFDQWLRPKLGKLNSQVVGLRYFNVYGPQENHKGRMASVVYQFHHQLLKEGKLKLFEGSDTFLRDFVYVKDVVDINLHFFENQSFSGILNAGTGEAKSFLDIAHIMQELYPKADLEFIPFPADLEGKYQKFTQADLTNLRAAGYDKDFTSLENGVKSYVELLQTQDGFYLP